MRKIAFLLLLAAMVAACGSPLPTRGLAGRAVAYDGSAYPPEGPDYSALLAE